MNKRLVGILLVIGVACRIIGGAITPLAHDSRLFALIGFVVLLSWNVLLAASVIGAMVKSAQMKQWVWFGVLFLVLPVFAFAIWGPSEKRIPVQV